MIKICNPYDMPNHTKWVRGNLHSHTLNSDGSCTAQTIVAEYAAKGYDFLMISDHDVFTSAKDHAALDAHGMILIPGNEITANGPHLLHINANRRIEPHEDRQEVITEANGSQSFVIANHPNWKDSFDYIPMDLLRTWDGYIGMEIYNGVHGRLDGSPYATNKWDMLLTDKQRIWGFANDDSHCEADVGLGWNMAMVTEATVDEIVKALRCGRFYASTGVTINTVEVDGSRIRITTENAQRIVGLKQAGVRFAIADDSQIEVKVPDDAEYVRFECWGPGERMAWTQPFFVERI